MIVFYKAGPEDAPLLSETRRKAWNVTYRGIYEDARLIILTMRSIGAMTKSALRNRRSI